jgi:hypothetical protein
MSLANEIASWACTPVVARRHPARAMHLISTREAGSTTAKVRQRGT